MSRVREVNIICLPALTHQKKNCIYYDQYRYDEKVLCTVELRLIEICVVCLEFIALLNC